MLSKNDILELLRASSLSERLIITPLLEQNQIGAASVDLRLGFRFLLPRRANIAAIDPMQKAESTASMHARYQECVTLSRGRELHLHPNEFVLGASLEYLRLPGTVGAYVTSRSSWGRSGLVIATAMSVAPGFCGVITLELANLGTAPMTLRPGVRIAQLVLHATTPSNAYSGRYRCPTGPEPGKIHLDDELDFWR